MHGPRPLEHADPLPLMGVSTAPLAGVLLALLALWAVALPSPLHAISLDIQSGCLGYTPPEPEPVVHTVAIDASGRITWNGRPLASRAALDALMQAAGAPQVRDQPLVRVQPHPHASYGSFTAVLASAQRHGVEKLDMVGEGFNVLTDPFHPRSL